MGAARRQSVAARARGVAPSVGGRLYTADARVCRARRRTMCVGVVASRVGGEGEGEGEGTRGGDATVED